MRYSRSPLIVRSAITAKKIYVEKTYFCLVSDCFPMWGGTVYIGQKGYENEKKNYCDIKISIVGDIIAFHFGICLICGR